MSKETLIQVKNVSKHFEMGGETIRAVDGVSLEIHSGDFVFIIGPSGSGKTTLLDMLGALSHPTKGEITIEGKKLLDFNDLQLSMFRRLHLGFIFQTFNLMPTLSALDNVLVPLVPSGYGAKETDKARSLLTDIGIGHRPANRPNQLSGGERQRVAIARAFINDPKIVLADEPTGNLDSKKGTEIFEYLRKLNREKKVTFVIVTHDTEYIRRGDKVFTMKDGKLNTSETTDFYVPKKKKVRA